MWTCSHLLSCDVDVVLVHPLPTGCSGATAERAQDPAPVALDEEPNDGVATAPGIPQCGEATADTGWSGSTHT